MLAHPTAASINQAGGGGEEDGGVGGGAKAQVKDGSRDRRRETGNRRW